MTEDALRDLAVLAALESLEGDDAKAFAAAASSSAECRQELLAFRRAVDMVPLSLRPIPPDPALRARVLASALGSEIKARSRAPQAWLGLAAAAVIACGVGFWRASQERDAALREAQAARAEATVARQQLRQAELQLAAALRSGIEQRGLQRLVAHQDARLSPLAGLQAAPAARGRVLWSRSRREALLVAAGLPPAPEGKGYEVWVIGRGAPVPAGVFQVDEEGGAVFRLPDLTETAEAKTFAVTLEPAAGTPAPTGPMVLAGSAT